MKPKVSIVDYGLANLYNVSNAFSYMGAQVEIIDTPEQIAKSDFLVLPGVGAFRNGMRGLILRNLIDSIKKHTQNNKPFLGICLGMQMMLTRSYEFGVIEGLNIIPGNVVKIPNKNKKNISHKIPHIGWNNLYFVDPHSQDCIFDKKINKASMYFVHSYKTECDNKTNIVAVTNYNDIEINAIIKHGNAYGCQFHPEKSGKYGLMLLNDFLNT
jgi:glutamine amidotransferase